MQKIYGSKAEYMLNEQRLKISRLRPGDLGYGLHFFIPEFNPGQDVLIIGDDGVWLVDHGVGKAAEQITSPDAATPPSTSETQRDNAAPVS